MRESTTKLSGFFVFCLGDYVRARALLQMGIISIVLSNQFLFHMHSSEDANGAVIYVMLSIYSVIHVYNLFLIKRKKIISIVTVVCKCLRCYIILF